MLVEEGPVARRRRHSGSPSGTELPRRFERNAVSRLNTSGAVADAGEVGWRASSVSRVWMRWGRVPDASSRTSGLSCGSRFPLIVRSGWSRRCWASVRSSGKLVGGRIRGRCQPAGQALQPHKGRGGIHGISCRASRPLRRPGSSSPRPPRASRRLRAGQARGAGGRHHRPRGPGGFAPRKLRTKRPAVRQALRGHVRAHHVFLVNQPLAHLDCLDEASETAGTQIDGAMAPFAEIRTRLDTIRGVNRRTCRGPHGRT